MRQKQINKLLAIRVPKILENLTKPYGKSLNPQNTFVYNDPPPQPSVRSDTAEEASPKKANRNPSKKTLNKTMNQVAKAAITTDPTSIRNSYEATSPQATTQRANLKHDTLSPDTRNNQNGSNLQEKPKTATSKTPMLTQIAGLEINQNSDENLKSPKLHTVNISMNNKNERSGEVKDFPAGPTKSPKAKDDIQLFQNTVVHHHHHVTHVHHHHYHEHHVHPKQISTAEHPLKGPVKPDAEPK